MKNLIILIAVVFIGCESHSPVLVKTVKVDSIHIFEIINDSAHPTFRVFYYGNSGLQGENDLHPCRAKGRWAAPKFKGGPPYSFVVDMDSMPHESKRHEPIYFNNNGFFTPKVPFKLDTLDGESAICKYDLANPDSLDFAFAFGCRDSTGKAIGSACLRVNGSLVIYGDTLLVIKKMLENSKKLFLEQDSLRKEEYKRYKANKINIENDLHFFKVRRRPYTPDKDTLKVKFGDYMF